MSLIEKAVQRLDQLKQAGGEPPLVEPRVEPRPQEHARRQVVPPVRPPEREVAAEDSVPAAPASRQIDIDLARLSLMGMVTPDQPAAAIAEQYRLIKRPLLRNAQGKGAAPISNSNLIMVTSSLPGEGKSFTAINLAVSMAMELDHTVLLVDADFARPSVLSRLGLPPQKGLMDVLVGDVPDLSDVILRTNIEKLSLLPAGMPHQRATELIASDAMNRMLDEMACRYAERIVVFDSPPLLATTEARVLAAHMGQIVVVVEAGRTTHNVVMQALSTIENCPVKLMLLNKARAQGPGGYYGYGYGYGSEARSDAAA